MVFSASAISGIKKEEIGNELQNWFLFGYCEDIVECYEFFPPEYKNCLVSDVTIIRLSSSSIASNLLTHLRYKMATNVRWVLQIGEVDKVAATINGVSHLD